MSEGGSNTPTEWDEFNSISSGLSVKEAYFDAVEDAFNDIMGLYWPTHESLGDTAEAIVTSLENGC